MIMEINRAEGFWMVVLFLTWLEFLVGGYVFGETNAENTRRMPTWTRMMASITLAIACSMWLYFISKLPINATILPDHTTSSGEMFTLGFFMALGMIFGLAGDLFMAGVIKAKNPVLFGMVSFGIGHVWYIIGLYHFGVVSGYHQPSSLLQAFVGWWLFAIIGWFVIVYYPAKHRSILHILALPYALLLAGTTAVATGLALQAIEFVPIAFGAFLFLVSDLILAGQIFNGFKFPKINDVVWLTYSPGQMLIVLTIPLLSVLQSHLY